MTVKFSKTSDKGKNFNAICRKKKSYRENIYGGKNV